jgi:CHAT domain-containing protein/tetratricopeptide (TPR) repeat protein
MTRLKYFCIRGIWLVKALCGLACAAAAVPPTAAGKEQPTRLHHESSFTREISPEEPHLFDFDLRRDQLIKLSVTAGDLNFQLRLSGPDGDTLQEIVHRRYGELTWRFVAPRQGQYRLTLTSLEPGARPRTYRLQVEEMRPASPGDKVEAQAAAYYYSAEKLRSGWQGDDLARAAQMYEAAGATWQRQSGWGEATDAWQRLGEVYFIQGNYKEALHSYKEALRLSRRANDSLLTLTQLSNVGYVYLYLGDTERASLTFAEVQSQLGKISGGPVLPLKYVEAQLENNFGEVEYARGNLKNSLDFFGRALTVWEEVGDRQGVALARLNKVYSYLDSGSVTEASSEIEECLRLWREADDVQKTALTLGARGHLQALTGDKYAALASYHEARDMFRRIGDRQGEAITSNGLGDIFEHLNLKDEAIDNYTLALKLNHAIGNKDFEAVSAYYLGRVYRDSDDIPRALEYYNTSLALSRKGGKARMIAQALMDVAGIYTRQGKFAEASKLYQDSLRYFEKISDLRRQALTHQGLGELHHACGELNEAAREYQQGLELFQRVRDPQGEAKSHYWLAKILQEQGRMPEALAESEKSIELIEDGRTLVLGQNWLSSYFASVHRYYELCVDILMQMHRQTPDGGFAARALQTSERARARTLLEMLNETQSEISRDVDPALLAQEQQLRRQLGAKAGYQIQALNAGRPESEIEELESEIRRLNSEYDFVQAQIKARSSAYAQLTKPSILTLPEIQAALKEDEGTVLLEYLIGDERSYLWLVTADKIITRELPGRQALETLSREVYEAMTARRQQPDEDSAHYFERSASAEEQFCPRAGQLSRVLLEPLAGIAKVRRLLVVADGGLHYIPFDALPLPTADDKVCRIGDDPPTYVPLLTSFEVVNLPSFSSLALLRRLNSASPAPAQGMAIWADPVFESDDPRVTEQLLSHPASARAQQGATAPITVPQQTNHQFSEVHSTAPPRLMETEREAASIRNLAPAGVTSVVTGFAANRDSVLGRDLKDYRILHFATHGIVDSRHPLLSGLLLSTIDEQGRSQNGLLQLQDIYGLRLNAELVVLSACQSGLGKELSGEGFVGLTQGFLYAGSRSVVASLWQVEDNSSAMLMKNFYQGLLEEGDSPAVALRRAKLMMYRQGSHQSPYYWAAFVMQGEFRPPVNRHYLVIPRPLWIVLALPAFLLWWYFCRKRRSQAMRH